MTYIKNPFIPPLDEPMLGLKNYDLLVSQALDGVQPSGLVGVLRRAGEKVTEREVKEFVDRIDPVHLVMGSAACKAFLGLLGDAREEAVDTSYLIGLNKSRLAYLLRAEEDAFKSGARTERLKAIRYAITSTSRLLKELVGRSKPVAEVVIEDTPAVPVVSAGAAAGENKEPLLASTPLSDTACDVGFASSNKILYAIEVLSRARVKSSRTVEDEVGDALGETDE